jgi:hypothetical protein
MNYMVVPCTDIWDNKEGSIYIGISSSMAKFLTW